MSDFVGKDMIVVEDILTKLKFEKLCACLQYFERKHCFIHPYYQLIEFPVGQHVRHFT